MDDRTSEKSTSSGAPVGASGMFRLSSSQVAVLNNALLLAEIDHMLPTDPSSEQISDALDRIVCARDPLNALHVLFLESDLGSLLLPELAALEMAPIPGLSHKENLRHSLQVCAQAVPRRRVRWAALCHDLGKAPTRRVKNGVVTFHNHEAVGAKMCSQMLGRLGFEGSFVADVSRLVFLSGRTHDFDETWTDSALRRVATEAGDLWDDLLALSRADCTSGRPGRKEEVSRQVDSVAARWAVIREKDERAKVRPALNGEQIAAHLKLQPGPVLGAAYRHLRELALAGQLLSEQEACEALDAWWASQQ